MPIRVVCLGLPLEGPTHVTVEIDAGSPPTLRELITRHLAPRYQGNLVQTLFDGARLREQYAVLVNGRNVLGVGGPDAPLGADDEILIMPPVSGG